MVDIDQLKKLRDACRANEQPSALASPEHEAEVASFAKSLLSSGDRNERVLAVRIIAMYPGQDAIPGILRALSDSERRVREVAIKCAKPFVVSKEIAGRLATIASDETEKTKLRNLAFATLSAPDERLEFDLLTDAAADAVHVLLKSEGNRSAIFLGLLQLQLSDRVVELLQSFVRDGSREEAVFATRALCGFRVVNIGKVSDLELKARIQNECDRAVGQVYYWVRRKESSSIDFVRL